MELSCLRHMLMVGIDGVNGFIRYQSHIFCSQGNVYYVSVCLSVRVFRSHQKSQFHEILAQGIWANLKNGEARFLETTYFTSERSTYEHIVVK